MLTSHCFSVYIFNYTVCATSLVSETINCKKEIKMMQNSFSKVILLINILIGSSFLSAEESTSIWIDVRTPAEYQQSSIDGHPNIPHTSIMNEIEELVTDKGEAIYLYCQRGRRAGLAKAMLEKMGYTNVTNAGGIDEVKLNLISD